MERQDLELSMVSVLTKTSQNLLEDKKEAPMLEL